MSANKLFPHDSAGLYAALVAAGIPIDSHQSDLYLPNTQAVAELLVLHGYARHVHKRSGGRSSEWIDFSPSVTKFFDRITGATMLEIAFAFQPYWDARTPKKSGTDSSSNH